MEISIGNSEIVVKKFTKIIQIFPMRKKFICHV